jgi:hypothetical protein
VGGNKTPIEEDMAKPLTPSEKTGFSLMRIAMPTLVDA